MADDGDFDWAVQMGENKILLNVDMFGENHLGDQKRYVDLLSFDVCFDVFRVRIR